MCLWGTWLVGMLTLQVEGSPIRIQTAPWCWEIQGKREGHKGMLDTVFCCRQVWMRFPAPIVVYAAQFYCKRMRALGPGLRAIFPAWLQAQCCGQWCLPLSLPSPGTCIPLSRGPVAAVHVSYLTSEAKRNQHHVLCKQECKTGLKFNFALLTLLQL